MTTDDDMRAFLLGDDGAAHQFFLMLRRTGTLSSHLAVTYRCRPRGCVLAYVLQTKQGLLVHRPRYKLSPDLNRLESSAEGRSANTVDGERRWKSDTFPISRAMDLPVSCDHVHGLALPNGDIEQDVKSGHAKVVLPRLG